MNSYELTEENIMSKWDSSVFNAYQYTGKDKPGILLPMSDTDFLDAISKAGFRIFFNRPVGEDTLDETTEFPMRNLDATIRYLEAIAEESLNEIEHLGVSPGERVLKNGFYPIILTNAYHSSPIPVNTLREVENMNSLVNRFGSPIYGRVAVYHRGDLSREQLGAKGVPDAEEWIYEQVMGKIQTLEHRLKKAKRYERPHLLREVYKQIARSRKGRQTNGLFREFVKTESNDPYVFASFVSEQLEMYGLYNEARIVRKQYHI